MRRNNLAKKRGINSYSLAMIVLLFCFSLSAEQVVYKYKKYERFDLGNLEVKGEILAPGDISVLERERKVFELKLLDRKEFDEEMIQNIIFLR